MATIANLFGDLVRKGIGSIPGVDLPSEKKERVMRQAFAGFEQDIASGTDASRAQINALAKASAGLAAEGFTEQANALRLQLVDLVKSEETRLLKLDNLKAQTGLAKARTSALLAPEEPDDPRDELTRMQQQRELLLAKFQANPDDKLVAEELDEVNARIDKITTITGRTEADERAINPTKKTLNDLQEGFLATVPRLDGMRRIINTYDPSALTLAGKAERVFYNAKEIAGFELTPDQKKKLVQHSTFAQNTVKEFNEYVRSVTGAQINREEVPRLRKGMPTLNDSPTEFRNKAINTLRQLTAAQRRFIAALQANDLTIMTQPLADFMPFDPSTFNPMTASPEELKSAIDAL